MSRLRKECCQLEKDVKIGVSATTFVLAGYIIER